MKKNVKIQGFLDIDDIIYMNSEEDLLEFVIELEKQLGTMDFTEPLYQYLKSIMVKEMPENL